MASRLAPVALGLAGLIAGSVGIIAGGHSLLDTKPDAGLVFSTEMDAETEALAEEMAGVESPEPESAVAETGTAASEGLPAPELEAEPSVERMSAPEVAAEDAEYERIAPRPPLSDLAQAKPPAPPPPEKPEQRRQLRLFNPVALAAGMLQVKGHKIELEGLEPTPVGKVCYHAGKSWPCGNIARTTFRAWLRSRAVQCKVPLVANTETIRTECNIGSADVGAWLVENGWATATEGSTYADLGKKAQEAGKGVFGPPPTRFAIGVAPVRPSASMEIEPEPVQPDATAPDVIEPETAGSDAPSASRPLATGAVPEPPPPPAVNTTPGEFPPAPPMPPVSPPEPSQ